MQEKKEVSNNISKKCHTPPPLLLFHPFSSVIIGPVKVDMSKSANGRGENKVKESYKKINLTHKSDVSTNTITLVLILLLLLNVFSVNCSGCARGGDEQESVQ